MVAYFLWAGGMEYVYYRGRNICHMYLGKSCTGFRVPRKVCVSFGAGLELVVFPIDSTGNSTLDHILYA